MTPTLRRELEQLKAQLAPEQPVLLAKMANGEDLDAVLAAGRERSPGVEFGMAVVTRVWGAPVREQFAISPANTAPVP